MKLKKFSAAALAALTVTMMSAAPVLAADDIEVNEDISVSGDYDWKRFANDHITLNVYNNGLYISDGSDESINVLSAFEELTGIKYPRQWPGPAAASQIRSRICRFSVDELYRM